MPNPSEVMDELIARTIDWRGETLAKLRKIIHDADPEIIEELGLTDEQDDKLSELKSNRTTPKDNQGFGWRCQIKRCVARQETDRVQVGQGRGIDH